MLTFAIAWLIWGVLVVFADMLRPGSFQHYWRSSYYNPIILLSLIILGAILWPLVLMDVIENPEP